MGLCRFTLLKFLCCLRRLKKYEKTLSRILLREGNQQTHIHGFNVALCVWISPGDVSLKAEDRRDKDKLNCEGGGEGEKHMMKKEENPV